MLGCGERLVWHSQAALSQGRANPDKSDEEAAGSCENITDQRLWARVVQHPGQSVVVMVVSLAHLAWLVLLMPQAGSLPLPGGSCLTPLLFSSRARG